MEADLHSKKKKKKHRWRMCRWTFPQNPYSEEKATTPWSLQIIIFTHHALFRPTCTITSGPLKAAKSVQSIGPKLESAPLGAIPEFQNIKGVAMPSEKALYGCLPRITIRHTCTSGGRLTFKQFQTGSTPSADMAHFVLRVILGCARRSVPSACRAKPSISVLFFED